jgi:hypothetical protein
MVRLLTYILVFVALLYYLLKAVGFLPSGKVQRELKKEQPKDKEAKKEVEESKEVKKGPNDVKNEPKGKSFKELKAQASKQKRQASADPTHPAFLLSLKAKTSIKDMDTVESKNYTFVLLAEQDS